MNVEICVMTKATDSMRTPAICVFSIKIFHRILSAKHQKWMYGIDSYRIPISRFYLKDCHRAAHDAPAARLGHPRQSGR
jgi:hypothetical protein